MTADFEFKDAHGDLFIIRLVHEHQIEKARAILHGKEPTKGVEGRIIPKQVSYNPNWDYHLEPDSISFFEVANEVCDAGIRYVQEHLAEIGKDFLPYCHWCPWSSRLTGEIT